MCGINGIINNSGSHSLASSIKQMNDALKHRGPDDEGVFVTDNIALGHRRLSIIDLSNAGHQPMFSSDGRYAVVYNGELYNYRELKLDLQRAEHGSGRHPYDFKTNTDTEVILASFIKWGNDCVKYFNGMFAFAIYDKQTNSVFIARDRMGVKPLYYYQDSNCFVFSSEIRSLLQSGLVKRKINNNVIAEYLTYQTVYAPETIIEGVKILLPGHFILFSENKIKIECYWDINSKSHPTASVSYEKAKLDVKNLFYKSVERRLISDVPFGAFLSGGIDSSAVVAAMAASSSTPINTFSITFDETEFNEAYYSSIIARRYNTKHHEIKLKPNDFLNELPNALMAMDFPSGDGVNTYVVSKATKAAGITMALSGIGGDELFAGYDVFYRQQKFERYKWISYLPGILVSPISFLNYKIKSDVSSRKLHEIMLLNSFSFKNTYPFSRMVLFMEDIKKLIPDKLSKNKTLTVLNSLPKKSDLIALTSLAEIQTYLQNILLRDTDQMSMANALEVREPFLDYTLVEYVLSLPANYKLGLTPKKLLTDALNAELPTEVTARKKMGFTFPWNEWMRGELKIFCENTLAYYKDTNILNYTEVLNLWNRFLSGDKLITWSRVWHLVVLAYWLKHNNIEE